MYNEQKIADKIKSENFIIKSKASYLNNLFIGAFALTAIAYLLLKFLILRGSDLVSAIIGFIMAIFISVAFYLNRNEVESLVFNSQEVKITFFNKFIFKTEDKTCPRSSFRVEVNGEKLLFYCEEDFIGVLRKSSVKPREWTQLIKL